MGSAPYTNPFLGVIINSAGASQPFDYEVYSWFEVVGSIARGASISFDDPIGYAAVNGAANQFQQLDSVLGIDGFLHAVSTQLQNCSGVGLNSTHAQNWAGLAAFLPQIASIATRAASAVGSGLMREFVDPPPRVISTGAVKTPKVPKPKVEIKKVVKNEQQRKKK